MNNKKNYIMRDTVVTTFNEVGELCYINVRIVKINQNFIWNLRRALCKKHDEFESAEQRKELIQAAVSELKRIIREVTNVCEDEITIDPYLRKKTIRRVVFENLDSSLIDRVD